MISPEEIRDSLSRYVVTVPTEDGVRVSTQVLYPSNGSVNVTIRGGANSFIVSDDGGAVSEIGSAGSFVPVSDRLLRSHVKNYGLSVQNGAIYSPVLPRPAIGAGVLLVANASRRIADWGISSLRSPTTHNFKEDLAQLLGRYFHDNLKRDIPIIGESNKPHKFVYVIHLGEKKKLLIDPVVNDASSINARLVSNLDVKRANDQSIEQLIVYDDKQKWHSSDLRLLELGAKTVSFSRLEPEIQRLAA